mmetsp:Transcript_115291/g.288042  ORF Transcript_115291/g.288042 Transcript_115291/m.288042 type:complete len:231 (+) Transcript_115291:229-921(+)
MISVRASSSESSVSAACGGDDKRGSFTDVAGLCPSLPPPLPLAPSWPAASFASLFTPPQLSPPTALLPSSFAGPSLSATSRASSAPLPPLSPANDSPPWERSSSTRETVYLLPSVWSRNTSGRLSMNNRGVGANMPKRSRHAWIQILPSSLCLSKSLISATARSAASSSPCPSASRHSSPCSSWPSSCSAPSVSATVYRFPMKVSVKRSGLASMNARGVGARPPYLAFQS